MITFLSLAVATALGVGYVPTAPGTAGSAVGLLLWAVLPVSAVVQTPVILGMLVVGSITGTVAERHFKKRDPRHVVLDEVMGMLITLYLIPVGWIGATIGFLLFRASDIIKPYPANKLEQLHGGVGVMADDLMAGIYANLALRVVIVFSNWVTS